MRTFNVPFSLRNYLSSSYHATHFWIHLYRTHRSMFYIQARSTESNVSLYRKHFWLLFNTVPVGVKMRWIITLKTASSRSCVDDKNVQISIVVCLFHITHFTSLKMQNSNSFFFEDSFSALTNDFSFLLVKNFFKNPAATRQQQQSRVWAGGIKNFLNAIVRKYNCMQSSSKEKSWSDDGYPASFSQCFTRITDNSNTVFYLLCHVCTDIIKKPSTRNSVDWKLKFKITNNWYHVDLRLRSVIT